MLKKKMINNYELLVYFFIFVLYSYSKYTSSYYVSILNYDRFFFLYLSPPFETVKCFEFSLWTVSGRQFDLVGI